MTFPTRLGEALIELSQRCADVGADVSEAAKAAAQAVADACGAAAEVWVLRDSGVALLSRAGPLARYLPPPDPRSDPRAEADAHPGDLVTPLRADGRVLGILRLRREAGLGEADVLFVRLVAERLTAVLLLAESCREHEVTKARFRGALRRSADVALFADVEGTVQYASESMRDLLGWDPEAMVGHSAFDIVHRDDLDLARARLAEAAAAPGPLEPFDLRLRLADGNWCWVEDRLTNLLEDPDVGAVVVNFHDISARHEAEEALRASERRYRSIVETAQEGIWVTDPDGRTVFANRRLTEILGRSLEELHAMRSIDVVTQEGRPIAAAHIRDRRLKGHDMYEVPIVRGDGEIRTALVAASALFDDDGEYAGSMGTLTDVTERRRAQQELERKALHDELTGLPNRTLLTDRLAQALAQRERAEPLVVLFLDLDGFKLVNDSYGHKTGDKLLQAVADRLHGVLRAGDTLARFAGDEFVLLCPNLTDTGAQALAERALACLAEPFDLDGTTVQIGASAGIAAASHDQELDSLVSAADAAMFEAKRRGRGGHVTFTPAIAARSRARLQLVDDLRRGIAAHEFVLDYQPLVNLTTGRIVAAEALVRWQHPTRGRLDPADFIPVAEQTGLIVTLGHQVLVAACEGAAAWARDGKEPIRLAVNISARQLSDDRFVDMLAATLQDTGLPPQRLGLELTETTVMDDVGRAAAVLRELRRLGVTLSIDDFGTGYSSLAYLTRLPLDELKIDRAFIGGVHQDGEAREIVRAITAMAHALDMPVVAEGVETPEQASALRDLGCDLGQGFLFARPGPPDLVAGPRG